MSDSHDDVAESIEARVGRRVCGGRYVVENVLGIGGMAAVYAASHRNGRKVAMKFLHPELSRRADIRRRFVREGQAANAVHHPGVVAVIDDDVAEDGSAFLVMERLEGKSLERVWEEADHRVPTRAVLAIARDLLDVLIAAHDAGIYHRDLKPENLFLTESGQLKVLDFGLAYLRDTTQPKDTHTGMVFGTPAFMPPEQASGQTSKLDARTDIWAVDATMFTLLSGKLVHPGENAQHFVVLAASEKARSLAEVMPMAHPVLVELIDRALAKEKESRWQSAVAMRDAVVAAMTLLLGDASVPIALDDARAAPKTNADGELDTEPQGSAYREPSGDAVDDATHVDNDLKKVPSSVLSGEEPTTQKKAVPYSSDTPTEKRVQQEPPTQIRRDPVDMQERANWCELRNTVEAIDDVRRAALPSSETSFEEQTRLNETAVLPLASARSSTANMPGFQSPPLRWTVVTHETAPSFAKQYGAVLGAGALFGLSLLAYVAVRALAPDQASAPIPTMASARSAADAGSVVTTSAPTSSAVILAEAPPPPVVDPSVAAPTAPTASSAPAIQPTPSPYVPIPLPLARGHVSPARCTPPFDLDDAGVKHWKVDCL